MTDQQSNQKRNLEILLHDIKHAEEKLTDLQIDKYGFGPWSFSKLKVLINCPYQFYLSYLLRVKREYLPRDSLAADIGTSAHRILELVMRGKDITTAFKEAEKEIVGNPNPGFGKASLTREQWDGNIITLDSSIKDFARRMDNFNSKFNIKRIHTELKTGISKEFEPTGFFGEDVFFRGIIDLCIQLDVNEELTDLIIIDHKHGGGEFNNTVRNYESQLDTYKVLFHDGVENINGAQSGIHFIKDNKMVWGDFKDKDTIENKLRSDLIWKIDGAVDTTKNRGFFKHIRGAHCKYCDFDAECKAGSLKENELSTKKYFTIKPVVEEAGEENNNEN